MLKTQRVKGQNSCPLKTYTLLRVAKGIRASHHQVCALLEMCGQGSGSAQGPPLSGCSSAKMPCSDALWYIVGAGEDSMLLLLFWCIIRIQVLTYIMVFTLV